MSKFYSLFSSSQGNASFLGGASGGLLIDAGVSCKKICQKLTTLDVPLQAVRAVLITHSHADHVSGLRVFLQQHPVPVYTTAETWAAIEHEMPSTCTPTWMEPNQTYAVDAFSVTPFPTPHDAAGSVGFRIVTPDDRICAICTDLGHVTPEVTAGITGADLVLLESNYDPGMLENGTYPPYLKQRIAGDYGHLSNLQSAECAVSLVQHGTTRLVLGHLSPHNNTPDLCHNASDYAMHEAGLVEDQDFVRRIAGKDGLSQAVIF